MAAPFEAFDPWREEAIPPFQVCVPMDVSVHASRNYNSFRRVPSDLA